MKFDELYKQILGEDIQTAKKAKEQYDKTKADLATSYKKDVDEADESEIDPVNGVPESDQTKNLKSKTKEEAQKTASAAVEASKK